MSGNATAVMISMNRESQALTIYVDEDIKGHRTIINRVRLYQFMLLLT